jgi:hypothetical protein
MTIPERMIELLRAADDGPLCRFPATEVFNEGWMLRLVLDAFDRLAIKEHPLSFQSASTWFSEARLESPFRPRSRTDTRSEGPTNADGVIAKLEIRADTRAGLSLSADTDQFVVVEAKMFSNLSTGTKNAPSYSQAARNVACMAEAIARTGRPLSDFASLGFHVVAPRTELRGGRASNLEASMERDAVTTAIRQRISGYEQLDRPEARDLQAWEETHLLPFVDRLSSTGGLSVLSWENCIEVVSAADEQTGAGLASFYERCLGFAPRGQTGQ